MDLASDPMATSLTLKTDYRFAVNFAEQLRAAESIHRRADVLI
jgi:hypothetical protein